MPVSPIVPNDSLHKAAGQRLSMEMQLTSAVGVIVILSALLIWEQHQISATALTTENAF
jgi:hypothetical protein